MVSGFTIAVALVDAGAAAAAAGADETHSTETMGPITLKYLSPRKKLAKSWRGVSTAINGPLVIAMPVADGDGDADFHSLRAQSLSAAFSSEGSPAWYAVMRSPGSCRSGSDSGPTLSGTLFPDAGPLRMVEAKFETAGGRGLAGDLLAVLVPQVSGKGIGAAAAAAATVTVTTVAGSDNGGTCLSPKAVPANSFCSDIVDYTLYSPFAAQVAPAVADIDNNDDASSAARWNDVPFARDVSNARAVSAHAALVERFGCPRRPLLGPVQCGDCPSFVTDACSEALRRFACYDTFPACAADGSGHAVGVCRDAGCEAVTAACGISFEMVGLSHLQCGSTRYVDDASGDCTPRPPPRRKGLSTGAIVAIVLGVLAAVGLIAVAAVVIAKKKKAGGSSGAGSDAAAGGAPVAGYGTADGPGVSASGPDAGTTTSVVPPDGPVDSVPNSGTDAGLQEPLLA
jgi:hypothetical protein